MTGACSEEQELTLTFSSRIDIQRDGVYILVKASSVANTSVGPRAAGTGTKEDFMSMRAMASAATSYRGVSRLSSGDSATGPQVSLACRR